MEKEKFQPILKIPLTNYVTWEKAELLRFQSERFIFTAQVGNIRHKLCQVFFGKSDGTIYVTFPYFEIKEGIASVGINSPFLVRSDINLETNGKVTSYPVKYAHHPDGEAHFSQDGRVKTLIRKKSVALQDIEDHIFTLYMQDLSRFEIDLTLEDHQPKLKRTILNFDFKDKSPKAVKIVGRWFGWKSLISRAQGKIMGPKVHGQTPDGKTAPMFLVGPPKDWPMEKYFLSISCEEIDVLDKNNGALMLFMGGFDKPSVINDLSQPSSFLCVSYPASNYKDLLGRIGSIDIDKL
jgi:hypothetical protein